MMNQKELVVVCSEVLTNILHGGADGKDTHVAVSFQ
jgi:anti-sigma regulatory factor (Ser/Thr protein kinase)